MGNWWEHHDTSPPQPKFKFRAVAYYRHSAQDRQENSISIQQDQVRAWAESNGVEIIHEFVDPGRSGLTAQGRPGFQDMMENWVKQRTDFHYILCLDVSRWGRFQDIDLSAQYSAECRKFGKEVIYTTIGKPREDDPLYPVYVQFERFRAAQYSRELSDKVFRGCVKIAQQGYWAGGKPRYGFRRLLLNEARQPVQILQPGERKSIQNQRVTLALGDEREVAVVRRIFREFTEGGRHEQAIAEGLNRDDIPSPGGRAWDGSKVRQILTDERYMGTMVYNRTTQKLKTPSRTNPRDKWVRTPESFERMIPPEVFAKAHQIFADRAKFYTPAYMLERLAVLLESHGMVRPSLVRAAADMPSPTTYIKHFGSMDGAFQQLFNEVRAKAGSQVSEEIEALVNQVVVYDDFLVIDEKLTVLVQPSVPMPHGLATYWFFRPDRREVIDITLGVPLSDGAQPHILGYLALPRLLVAEPWIRLFSTSHSRLEMFGHNGLAIIEQLLS
ncbi:MAG TPA: recombinase family protein [Sedimentisphaerales bacterium]|nr:recombinase family protein [Sedimentisphaerales bacterium]